MAVAVMEETGPRMGVEVVVVAVGGTELEVTELVNHQRLSEDQEDNNRRRDEFAEVESLHGGLAVVAEGVAVAYRISRKT